MPCWAMTRKTNPAMGGTPDGMTWMPGRFIAFKDIAHPFFGKAADPVTCPSFIIEILDAEKEEAEAIFLVGQQTEDDTENHLRTVEVDLMKLPKGICNSLATTGTARVTMGQLRKVSRHVLTGRPGF